MMTKIYNENHQISVTLFVPFSVDQIFVRVTIKVLSIYVWYYDLAYSATTVVVPRERMVEYYRQEGNM